MLTLLPAILALLGRAAFWPFRPGYQSHPAEEHGFWGRVSRFVGRRSRLVWAVTGLALIASVAFLLGAAISDTRNSMYALVVLAISFPVYLLMKRRGVTSS